MDKNGWQKPNIDVGMTGIQKCIQTRKAQKHAEAVEIIAAGNSLADSRQNAIKTFLG